MDIEDQETWSSFDQMDQDYREIIIKSRNPSAKELEDLLYSIDQEFDHDFDY